MEEIYPVNDQDYEDNFIKKVTPLEDGWEVSFNHGACFYIPKPSPIVPKKNMLIRMYPGGLGFEVRGCFLNGRKVFYRTEEKQAEKRRQQVVERNIKEQENFEKNKENYFNKISQLPEVFQKRIAKFQNTNPDYDWKFGSYELFCCEQAVVFATQFKTEEALLEWNKKDYKEQKKECPGLSDGHSGNTFGMSLRLARWYITDPDLVIKDHGALTPLVGCIEYGCPHEKTDE